MDVWWRWTAEEKLEFISLCRSPAVLISQVFSKYSYGGFSRLLESDARDVQKLLSCTGERLTQAPEEQSQHRACGRKKHSSHSSAAWSRTAHAVSSSICCNCHFKPLLSTKYKTSGCWFCTFETAVSASRSHSRP